MIEDLISFMIFGVFIFINIMIRKLAKANKEENKENPQNTKGEAKDGNSSSPPITLKDIFKRLQQEFLYPESKSEETILEDDVVDEQNVVAPTIPESKNESLKDGFSYIKPESKNVVSKSELRRALILGEVLNKPISLRE
jgi:hypothetical protein